MDVRNVIALPATLLFVVCGFYWVVAQRLRGMRARIAIEGSSRIANRWQRLTPREKMMRRSLGILLGVVAAIVLQVIGREIIDAASR
jgi:hypothetical protein